jgi:hypothetical protein
MIDFEKHKDRERKPLIRGPQATRWPSVRHTICEESMYNCVYVYE